MSDPKMATAEQLAALTDGSRLVDAQALQAIALHVLWGGQ